MKKVLQQVALAIVFGLGIPGLIMGAAASSGRKEPVPTDTQPETTAWVAPVDTEKEEVSN